MSKKIVFTNGCFDVLHPGHVHLFNMIRETYPAFSYEIVVGINSDASVRRLKGPKRPLYGEKERVMMVEALGAVNRVVMFEEDTPLELIKTIQPHILVKGMLGNMQEAVVGSDLVEIVSFIKMKPGYSTTELLNYIKAL